MTRTTLVLKEWACYVGFVAFWAVALWLSR